MTDLRKAAEMMAYEVPLHELLEGVPENARLVIDSEDGMSTSFIPVGLYCKRAAQALRQALAQPEQRPANFYLSPPPKREWVGLTDEDIDLYALDIGVTANKAPPWLITYARDIEAKLKQKNEPA